MVDQRFQLDGIEFESESVTACLETKALSRFKYRGRCKETKIEPPEVQARREHLACSVRWEAARTSGGAQSVEKE